MKLCWKKLDKLIIAPPPSNDAMSSPVVNPLQKGTAYDVISFESEVGVGEEELELEGRIEGRRGAVVVDDVAEDLQRWDK